MAKFVSRTHLNAIGLSDNFEGAVVSSKGLNRKSTGVVGNPEYARI